MLAAQDGLSSGAVPSIWFAWGERYRGRESERAAFARSENVLDWAADYRNQSNARSGVRGQHASLVDLPLVAAGDDEIPIRTWRGRSRGA